MDHLGTTEQNHPLRWAGAFLACALICGVPAVGGLAGPATGIATFLFIVFLAVAALIALLAFLARRHLV